MGPGLRLAGAALAAASALAAAVSGPAMPAGATASTLALTATWGGPGHAKMYPSGVEIGPDGSIVIADTGNNQVAKLTASGQQLWRTGSFGTGLGQFNNPRDVGIDADGTVYVGDTVNGRIVKLDGTDGHWITSSRGNPADPIGASMGVSATGHTVYVADALRKKVRILNSDLAEVRSFGQSGACTFSALRDVEVDSAGNFYVANYTLDNILKLSPAGDCLKSWGTKGSAPGQFMNPYGVATGIDPGVGPAPGTEVLYVADSNNGRIQEFSLDGGFITAFGATGDYNQPGTFTTLRRVAVGANGFVCGADLWGWRLSCFQRSGGGYVYSRTIPNPVFPPAGYPEHPFTATQAFNEPRGLAFDASGNTYVADTANQRIVQLNANGAPVSACGGRGEDVSSFNWPRGVAVDTATGKVWVADTKSSRIQVIRPPFASCSKYVLGSRATVTNPYFNWPSAVAIRQSDSTAWFADWRNNRITVWSLAGKELGHYGIKGSGTGQLNGPMGIGIAPNGAVYVADTLNNRVVKLTAGAGATNIAWGGSFTAAGQLKAPQGVDADAAGRIYVADTGHSQLVALSGTGAVLATASGFNSPANVAVRDSDGRVVVADTYNDRLQVYRWQ